MKCIINQGLPGSGKSTSAREHMDAGHVGHTVVCSADDYHMVDGVYNYKPENQGAAHAACFSKFELETRKHRVELQFIGPADFVFVDNTNISLWEMSPYVMLACQRGYEVEVHTFECSVETSAARNVHGVPKEVIASMSDRMEYPPHFWNCTHVVHE